MAVADEAARVRELPIGRRREIARRHPKRSHFDDFGLPGPKIFFACGALKGASGRATAPAGPNRLPPLYRAPPSVLRGGRLPGVCVRHVNTCRNRSKLTIVSSKLTDCMAGWLSIRQQQ